MSSKLRLLWYGQLGKSVIYWNCCKQRTQAAGLKAMCSLFVLYLPNEGVCPTSSLSTCPWEYPKLLPRHIHIKAQ